MKICWDNLENVKLIKEKYFRKGTNTYVYRKACVVCGEPYLTEKTRQSDTCSNSCGLTGKKWTKERRRKQSENMMGNKNNNYKGGVVKHDRVVYDTYVSRLDLVEDIRRNPNNYIYLQSKCSVCGKWFSPGCSQVCRRIIAIEGTGGGVGKFYCSDICKYNCSVYKKQLYPAGHNPRSCRNEASFYTEYELKVWSKEVLKRADFKCEYCGEKAEHAHHIKPKKLEPFFALDPDYGIAVCKKCHFKYGHVDDCSTGNLAKEVCI